MTSILRLLGGSASHRAALFSISVSASTAAAAAVTLSFAAAPSAASVTSASAAETTDTTVDGKPCKICGKGKQSKNAFAAMMGKQGIKLPGQKSGVECPADRESLGKASWTVLHTIAAYYPKLPSVEEQTQMTSFLKLFTDFYPCPDCREDFQVLSRAELMLRLLLLLGGGGSGGGKAATVCFCCCRCVATSRRP